MCYDCVLLFLSFYQHITLCLQGQAHCNIKAMVRIHNHALNEAVHRQLHYDLLDNASDAYHVDLVFDSNCAGPCA